SRPPPLSCAGPRPARAVPWRPDCAARLAARGPAGSATRWRRAPAAGACGLALAGVTPHALPLIARHVGYAPVAIEEFVGYLEDRKHQPALRAPGHMTTADLAPHELAGTDLEPGGGAFLVDELALDHPGLLDLHVLMIGQHGTGRKPHQRGHQPGLAIEQQGL